MIYNILYLYIICFILFPVTIFLKTKKRKKELYNGFPEKNDTLFMRGVAALSIVIAHYVLLGMDNYSVVGPITIYKWAGGIGVCIFFFCSGYGLCQSSQNKGMKNFLWKRMKGILPTYWIIRLISAILLLKYREGFLFFILYILGIKEQAWFITEILIVYLLFFISFRISSRFQIAVMSVLLLIMSCTFWKMGLEARWYNANMVFILGMILAKYRSSVLSLLKKYYWLLLTFFSLGLLFLTIVFSKANNIQIIHDIIKLPVGGIICILFVMVLMKLELSSPFILFFGKYSLELYIIHITVWQVTENLNLTYQIRFIICVCISLICIWIYSAVKKLLLGAYIRRIEDKQTKGKT